MVEKVGNLLMFPAFHNVEQSDQKSGFQKDMYSLFLQIDTIIIHISVIKSIKKLLKI